MHRVLSDLDVCFAEETHVIASPPATGVSAGKLRWDPDSAKVAETVEMGSMRVKPLGMGHDAGIMRTHILVAIPPTASVKASLEATAKSSLKPQFSAHLSQAGCGGSSLPMTAEPLPAGIGVLVGTVCGSPKCPAPLHVPLVPLQSCVWTGMTAGDIVGGIVNMWTDITFGTVLSVLGDGTSSVILKTILKALPIRSILGKKLGINLDTGFSNPGSEVQKFVDNDGVSSDAKPGFRVGGWGVSGGKPATPWT